MSKLKRYNKKQNVFEAAKERIAYTFDNFSKIYVSFSAGKDSSVMLHMVLDEAIKRDRKVGVMLIDLEAQYTFTIKHAEEILGKYKEHIELYWICLPLSLRNAVSNFEPKWTCWDEDVKKDWVRDIPEFDGVISDESFFPFFKKGMEFEEFMILFGHWYSQGENCATFVGIRTDESLNRFRTIASETKKMHGNKRFTTYVEGSLYNVYPIFDWKVSDIWHYHYVFPENEYNQIYDYMYKAGMTPNQMRLCQPYGDDQRRGLWLFHLLEPETWFKVVSRVNGVNSGSLYIQENGNITGYNKISKPENHTWRSFCNLLLQTLPEKTRDHYIDKFKTFLGWWKKRGYTEGIPDCAPVLLENKKLAPSWRRLCKVILRNDYYCKGLCFTQPKSSAYGEYLSMKKRKEKQ